MMFNKNKQFLRQELDRYAELMQNEIPGTEEYEQLKNSYLSVYSKLYSEKSVKETVLDLLKIFVPAGVSVGLGIFAYHKNQELESKDGDVWREARRR